MTTLIHAPKGQSTINRLLAAWTKAVLRYDMVWGDDDDCCWWYNERANVSVLAGAAWAEGWVAIEECGTVKRVGGDFDPNQVSESKGRLDLYIATATEHFAFEAKMAWQDLDPFSSINPCDQAVKLQLSEAVKDARKLVDEADIHYAATFIVPFFKNAHGNGTDLQYYQTVLTQWLESLQKHAAANNYLIAYVFPRLDQPRFINAENALFPGVVLILEAVS